MKRTYLLLLATIFSIHTVAQVEFEQGTFLLEMGSTGFKSQSVSSWEGLGAFPDDIDAFINGTNFDFSDAEFSDIYEKYNRNELNVSVAGGYFITNGLVLGLGLNYKSATETIEYTNGAKDLMGEEDYSESESELVISPMVRYYFGESGFWTSFSYAIATINMDDSDGSFDDEEFPKRSAMNLVAGYAISLNDYVSLNPAIGYNLTTQTTKDAGYNAEGEEVDQVIKSGSFGVGVSLTVHLSRY
jgi:hypothetical protein